MAGRAKIHIVEAIPGHASIKRFIERFAHTTGSVFTSSNSPVLACARTIVEANHEFLPQYELGQIEVVPLGILIHRLTEMAEIQTYRLAPGDEQIALAGAACEKIGDDSFLFDSRELPGLHRAVVSTAQELRRARVPLELLESVGDVPAAFAEVARNIELAMEAKRFSTLTTRIEQLLQERPVRPRSLLRIFWAGETEWPPLWSELIEWLAAAGVEINLLVEKHPIQAGFYPPKPSCANVTIEGLEIAPAPTASTILGGQIPNLHQSVELTEVSDDIAECEWAIRRAALLREKTVDSNSIQIFCPAIEHYGAKLDSSARKLGVSLSMTRKEPLLNNPFAVHCLNALRAAASGDIRNTANLALSSYSDIPNDDRRKCCQEVRACIGLADEWGTLETGGPAWFRAFALWRSAQIEFNGTLADWMRRLNQLVSRMPWMERSLESASPTKERDISAQDAMVRSLKTESLRGEASDRMTFSQFIHLVERAWSNAEYWIRSNGEFRVVSSVHEIGSAAHIIAIGFAEAKFPKRRSEDPILLDKHRQKLNDSLGRNALPTSYQAAEESRREFHRLLCHQATFYISWPARSSDSLEIRSTFIEDLLDADPTITIKSRPLELRLPNPNETISRKDLIAAVEWSARLSPRETDHALNEMLSDEERGLRTLISNAIRNCDETAISSDEIRKRAAAYPQPFRLSYLRSLKRCPFQYFAIAKLGLSNSSPRGAWHRLQAVIRRTNLVEPKDESALSDALLDSLDKEMTELRTTADRDELELMRISAPPYLRSFANREFQSRSDWQIKPLSQNARLSDYDFRAEVPTPAGQLKISETVDMMYSRNGTTVPMRLGYIPRDPRDPDYDELDEFQWEAGLYFLFQQPGTGERLAIVDAPTLEIRKALARDASGRAVLLPHKDSLHVDKRPETSKKAIQKVHTEFKRLLEIAASGGITPTPSQTNCPRCQFAGLCRKSPNSQQRDEALDT